MMVKNSCVYIVSTGVHRRVVQCKSSQIVLASACISIDGCSYHPHAKHVCYIDVLVME